MPIIHDGDDMILSSNSERVKGKVYLGESKQSYFDESSNTLHIQGDTEQTGDQVISGDMTADTFNGPVVGDVTGDVTGNSEGTHTGDVVGDVTGDILGDVTGDLTGDSAGEHTGAVIGDITGDVTGDLYGAYKGTKSALVADPSGTTDACDTEARTAIGSIIDALVARGLMDAT